MKERRAKGERRFASIRWRIFQAVALTMAGFLAIVGLFVYSVIGRSFSVLERANAQKDVERVRDALQQRVDDLDTKAKDWSNWDDLWVYMHDGNKAFATSNLRPDALGMLKVAVMVIYTNQGEVRNLLTWDPRRNGPAILEPEVAASFKKGGSIAKDVLKQGELCGIARVGRHLLIVNCDPIVHSDSRGPRAGYILIARWLETQAVRELANTTHLNLSSLPWSEDLEHQRADLVAQLWRGKGTSLNLEDEHHLTGYVQVSDYNRRPAAIVTMSAPRSILHEARHAQLWLIGALVAACICFGAAICVGLEKDVLRRLARLSRQVSDIGEGPSGRSRVDEGRMDEIGFLSCEINHLLAAKELAASELQESNRMLKASEEGLELAVQGAQASIFDWNLTTGEIHYSPRLAEMLGFAPSEFGTGVEAFLCRLEPKDREAYLEACDRHLEQRQPLSIEVRVRTADQDLRWFHCTGQAVWDEAGRAVRMAGTYNDITARKLAELDIRKFFFLLENAEDLVAMAGVDGSVAYANPPLVRLLGLGSSADAIGVHFADLLGDGLAESIRTQVLPQALADGRWEGEMSIAPGDGGPVRSVQQHVFVVHDPASGEPLCYAIVGRDVTDSKLFAEALARARDEALAATQAKAMFLANMSHEIRTPMNGVIGMTELLLDTRLDAEQREFANLIRGSADSLLGVINDILDFSKMEAGRLEVEDADLDLRQILEETSLLLASRAHEKGLEVACRIPPDLPRSLRGDPVRVRQIVTNLLGNAIKFTEEGEVVVRAEVSKATARQAIVRISVVDTGIGIAEDRQDAVFESFTQADGTSSRRYGGTGLGLTICRQLAALMGGTMGLRSAPGEGSTFWVELPLKIAPKQPGVEASSANLASLRVLVVDDNSTNRLILHENLTAWGCQVGEAANGEEALACLRSGQGGEQWNTVLLDMQMPGLDGEATISEIRKDPNLKSLRVILLTSVGLPTMQKDWRAMGFDGALVKPVHQARLRQALTPATPRDPSATAGYQAASIDTDRPLDGVYVLLVEDSLVNQKVAARVLGKLGAEVEVAGDGLVAIEKVGHRAYDIVLMDCQMPRMDGFEATREIRRREQGTSGHLPIYAMTANVLDGDRERCLAAGMDGYLAKPVKPQELAEALSTFSTGRPSLAATPRGDDLPVLDAERFLDQCGSDQEFVRTVIAEYLESAIQQIEGLHAAVEAGDADALASTSHALKGSTRTVGGLALGAVMEGLELAAKAGQNGVWATMLARAESELERLRAELAGLALPRAA